MLMRTETWNNSGIVCIEIALQVGMICDSAQVGIRKLNRFLKRGQFPYLIRGNLKDPRFLHFPWDPLGYLT